MVSEIDKTTGELKNVLKSSKVADKVSESKELLEKAMKDSKVT